MFDRKCSLKVKTDTNREYELLCNGEAPLEEVLKILVYMHEKVQEKIKELNSEKKENQDAQEEAGI